MFLKAAYQQMIIPSFKKIKICFIGCTGNMAHYNDILIILCQSITRCVSGDLRKESYLSFNCQVLLQNIIFMKNRKYCKLQPEPNFFFSFFSKLVMLWTNYQHLQNRAQKGKHRSFPPSNFAVHTYISWKKYAVIILKWVVHSKLSKASKTS